MFIMTKKVGRISFVKVAYNGRYYPDLGAFSNDG